MAAHQIFSTPFALYDSQAAILYPLSAKGRRKNQTDRIKLTGHLWGLMSPTDSWTAETADIVHENASCRLQVRYLHLYLLHALCADLVTIALHAARAGTWRVHSFTTSTV